MNVMNEMKSVSRAGARRVKRAGVLGGRESVFGHRLSKIRRDIIPVITKTHSVSPRGARRVKRAGVLGGRERGEELKSIRFEPGLSTFFANLAPIPCNFFAK